eukprot:7584539-Ditylum_brightwellii.AAC.2
MLPELQSKSKNAHLPKLLCNTLQTNHQRSGQWSNQKQDELIARLETRFEEGKAEIWESYRWSVAAMNESEEMSESTTEIDPATDENTNPSQETAVSTATNKSSDTEIMEEKKV